MNLRVMKYCLLYKFHNAFISSNFIFYFFIIYFFSFLAFFSYLFFGFLSLFFLSFDEILFYLSESYSYLFYIISLIINNELIHLFYKCVSIVKYKINIIQKDFKKKKIQYKKQKIKLIVFH